MCKISVCSSTSARSRSGSLYEDPLGHCIRILLDNLCKICVSGSLYKISVSGFFGPLVSGPCTTTCARSLYLDPVGPLYQDPAGQLVPDRSSDLCVRILWTTCIRIHLYKIPVMRTLVQAARSLYQDPVGSLLSGSCRTTSARSLSQDLCVRIHFWATCIKIL